RYSCLIFPATPACPPQLHTLSLHDALPILASTRRRRPLFPRTRCPLPARGLAAADSSAPHALWPPTAHPGPAPGPDAPLAATERDRKSTRLNSSHVSISYAVFCLKKKNVSK